ncbi:MAG: lysylphosphatidylglycerol synthase domain-containing protein [Bacillota bacterium]
MGVIYLSVAGWLAIVLVPNMILAGLGVKAPSEQVMANVILLHMVSSYVPTPGASGAAELGFAELFRTVVPPALIGLAVARWRLRTYYFTLLVGGTLTLGRQGMRDEFWAGV